MLRVVIGVATSLVLLGAAVLVILYQPWESKGTLSSALTPGSGPLAAMDARGGGVWEVEGGGFIRTAEGVRVQARTPAIQATAVFVPGSEPTVISSRMQGVVRSSGLIFRYQDDQNYWSLVAAPEFGTWNLNRTTSGKTDYIANTQLGFNGADSIVEVRLAATSISIYVNGQLSQQVVSPALVDAHGLGILASPADQGDTVWATFAVQFK
jgi:hypothetical protein